MGVIEIESLRKTFRSRRRGDRTALAGFDMVVEAGQVHGFLGPNGSGKTTTLRVLLGLIHADGGRAEVLGQPSPAGLPAAAGRIGAIVESPAFFGNFTGRRTLRLLATAAGIDHARVDEVLEQVGLRDRAEEPVKAYSLGMRQRLAVASALLKRPELLILDEPANGLDPAGIREMRDLMRDLSAAGTTVLISSHILGEIQLICDSVTIISRGRRVVAGPVATVLSGFDRGEYRVRVADHRRAAGLVAESGLPVVVGADHFVVSDLADPAWVTETLGRHELWVTELTRLSPDLEQVFLRLTGTMPEPGPHRPPDEPVPEESPSGESPWARPGPPPVPPSPPSRADAEPPGSAEAEPPVDSGEPRSPWSGPGGAR